MHYFGLTINGLNSLRLTSNDRKRLSNQIPISFSCWTFLKIVWRFTLFETFYKSLRANKWIDWPHCHSQKYFWNPKAINGNGNFWNSCKLHSIFTIHFSPVYYYICMMQKPCVTLSICWGFFSQLIFKIFYEWQYNELLDWNSAYVYQVWFKYS